MVRWGARSNKVRYLQVLKSVGINLKDARHETEKIIGRGSGFVAVEIPFTPRAKRVLELSLEEARQLGELLKAWVDSEDVEFSRVTEMWARVAV